MQQQVAGRLDNQKNKRKQRMWPNETSSGRTMMVYAALGTKKQQATEEKNDVKNAVSADGLNPVACESTPQDPELRAPRRGMRLERLSTQ